MSFQRTGLKVWPSLADGGRLGRKSNQRAVTAESLSDLLLYYEGTNGSSSVVDSSAKGHTITNSGNALISDVRSKTGSTSILFNGTGTGLMGDKTITVPGDFMWQTWWYPTAYAAGYSTLFGLDGANSWELFINDDGNRPLFFLQSDPGFTILLDSNYVAVPLNQWNHVAVTRQSNNLRLFLNGTQRGSTVTFSTTIEGVPKIGKWYTNSGTNIGHLDVTQMVTGSAVYTSSFTPSDGPWSG